MTNTCRSCDETSEVTVGEGEYMCQSHFNERCRGLEGKPAMSNVFGPSKLTVLFDPEDGDVVPDSKITKCIQDNIKDFISYNGDYTHKVGSLTMVVAYQAAVKRGDLESFHIIVKYKDSMYCVDKYGNELPDERGNYTHMPDISSQLFRELF